MQSANQAASASVAPQRATGRFVINLMSSTTPMALAQPNHPQLKSYTFFITRRRQDHRERFRLHMGYFQSQQQAEEMLAKVREIFPSAWAGIAPGNTEQKQAAQRRAVTAASYELPHIAVQVPATEAAAHAPVASAPVAAAPVAAPAAAAARTPAASPPVPAAPPTQHAATQSLKSVRAAISALDDVASHATADEDTSSTAQLKVLTAASAIPTLSAREVLKVLEPPASIPKPVPQHHKMKHAPKQAPKHVAKPAMQVNSPAAAKAVPAPAPAAAAKDAPVPAPGGFAVQLQWSAAPIDIAQLPYLAIFEAYTLYIAEGKREGRCWYGLRLGFFSDGASAKQVAQYLRSEFASVAVVPISVRERDRAKRAAKAIVASALPAKTESKKPEDYQLLDVEVATGSVPKAVAEQALSQELIDLGSNPVKTTAHKAPLTLEQTLEILGANNVTLQTSQSEMLSSSAVRSLQHAADQPAPEKRSALGKLFDRLGENLGR